MATTVATEAMGEATVGAMEGMVEGMVEVAMGAMSSPATTGREELEVTGEDGESILRLGECW